MDGLAGIGVDTRAGTQQVHMTLSSEWVEAIRQSGKGYSQTIIHALASELKGRITPLRARDSALAALGIAAAKLELEAMTAQDLQDAQMAIAGARRALNQMYVG